MATSPTYALGFDIGGTKIAAAVVSDRGEILRETRTATPKDYQKAQEEILKIIQDLKGKEPLTGIGFGIPGSIDPKTNLLRNAPNSAPINGTPFFLELSKAISKQFHLPTKFENDANCLALSEFKFGASQNTKNSVGIIVGTGVGSGVILDGKLFVGQSGLAPELGHTILEAHGRKCLCGNLGCVEAYLSGPSTKARYVEAGGTVDFDHITDIFRSDDKIAKKVTEETKYLFSRFLAAIVSMYNPEVIVPGGGMTKAPLYYECDEMISKFVFGSSGAPKILKAKNGDASGKLGAAALFF